MTATLIDLRALGDVAAVSFLASVALVTAFSTAVLAYDRAGRGGSPAPWRATLVLAAAACLAILAVGAWAMTQKS